MRAQPLGYHLMVKLGHTHRGSGRARLWLESVEDQVPTDLGRVIQISKSDQMARGIAFNLLQMAKRISPQCKAAEYEDLFEEKSLTLDHIAIDDSRIHQA